MREHLKSLEGFRGIAILGVFLIHVRLFPLGWIGVPMFFVLSGYLCTSSLLHRIDKGGSGLFQGIYRRRLIRILPAYLIYLACCAAFYAATSAPKEFPDSWLGVMTLTHNFQRMNPGFIDSDFFGHLWFLSVMEQLYLLWPLLLFFCPRSRLTQLFIALIILIPLFRFGFGFSLGHFGYDLKQAAKTVVNFPLSHLDSVAMGSLVACVAQEQLEARRGFLLKALIAAASFALVVGILWAWYLQVELDVFAWKSLGFDYGMTYGYQYAWGWSVVAGCCVLLLLNAVHGKVYFRRMFEIPFFRFMGKISFGFYIWHLPLFALFSRYWKTSHHSASGVAKAAVVFALSVFMGWLVHVLIEKRLSPMILKVIEGRKAKVRLSPA
jgi:peptidoglycan/LPS O-acetylase OafA/YrhL